jgi:hypothetical protein
MVLKPWPLNVPAKAAIGPRLGADALTALGAVRFDTSLILKPLGSEKAGSRWMSVKVPPLEIRRHLPRSGRRRT